MQKRISTTSGFSLVEILIAAAIIATTLVSIVGIASQSVSVSHQSLNTYTASTLLEEGAEAVRTLRDTNWSSISSLTNGTTYYPVFSTTTNTWSLSTTPATVGIFTRSIVLSQVTRNGVYDIASSGTLDTNTRLVTVTVSWAEGSRTVTKTLSFYILNIFS